MTTSNINTRLNDLASFKFNPAKIQRAALETLRAMTDGSVQIVDATNPFVFALETTSVNTTSFMQHAEAIHRRQYSIAATTDEDLYYHMNDKDYIGRFALPTSANFTVMFRKDELLNALVLDPLTGMRKITIPRNTVFKVADITYSLQYPVDIRELPHGALQVVYDVSVLSPLQELSTNLIEWQPLMDPTGVEFIQFTVETSQFNIVTKFNDVNAASGFKTTLPLSDAFYYLRVYMQQSSGAWSEIITTHNQQVYDPKTPTAVVQVLEGKVAVTIPVIYTTTGLVRNKIRIDLYETKGPLTMLLSNYKLEDFSVMWKAIDPADASVYAAPLRNLKTVVVYSISAVTGGRPALSLEELRKRVILNTVGPQLVPITNVQLQSSLEDSGYEVVKNVDTITNRIFYATKPMPKPVDSRLITEAAASVATVLLSFSDAANAYGVNIHAKGVTLTPDALYQNVNGVTRLVTTSAYQQLTSLTTAQLCLEVNAKNYLHTPFHYVLDASGTTFDVRPYYMDTPQILSKSFVEENASTGLQVSVAATYQIERTPAGYRLTISTASSESFRSLDDDKVHAQLSFRANGQPVSAFLLGTQLPRESVDDERVYVFEMTTKFNIDAANTLDQTAFTFSPTDLTTRSDLLQEMSVFFATSQDLGMALRYTSLDNALGRYQLPSNAIGITHEKLKVRFGHALTTLWSQGRSVVGSVPYQTHDIDVPRLYSQDVYDLDPVTGAAFSVSAEGVLTYNLLHAKNDPVLDALGAPVYQYRQGDPVLDQEGNPLPRLDYSHQLIRHVDVTVIEGIYRFANDSVAINYRKLLTNSLVSWLTEDLAALSPKLLDRTMIYFYPKVTLGDIRVMSHDGIETKTPAGQSFRVTLHVPTATYENPLLLASIKKTTISAIDAAIKGLTTAISHIQTILLNKYGGDVIDVKVGGLGGAADYSTLTVLDKSNRLSIRKRLVALPDEQLIVEEDIQFEIIEHALKSPV